MRNYVALSLVLLLSALLPSGSRAQNADWEAAIVRVEKPAMEYADYAFNILGSIWVGPANYSIKFHTHRCAIIGRMLGQSDAIRHIETIDYPPINRSIDAFDLLIFSMTLENWVAAARSTVEMNRDERVNVWNLECVGEMRISANLFMKSAQPNATFEINGRTLVVYGHIDVGFFDRLEIRLDSNPTIEEVALGSGGGSIRDALLAGYEIRRRGLSTTLNGNCFSACPLVFMGGLERILWASPHRLGFHQIYTDEGTALSADDPVYGLIAQYMVTMGVNPRVVIPWMLSARPSEMFEPDVSDLCSPGVSTFVQRVCGW